MKKIEKGLAGGVLIGGILAAAFAGVAPAFANNSSDVQSGISDGVQTVQIQRGIQDGIKSVEIQRGIQEGRANLSAVSSVPHPARIVTVDYQTPPLPPPPRVRNPQCLIPSLARWNWTGRCY